MRLKTFYAKTMTEAMHMVRDALGDDAVIIATREENGGKSVRVTAAVEQGADVGRYNDDAPHFEVGSKNNGNERDDWLQYDDEEDYEGQLTEELTDVLLRHVVPTDVMDNILATASMTGADDALTALAASLEHLFSFAPLPAKSTRKALMLVGPPGAGKTLATAKLATNAVMNDLKVVVITTDTVRAGGVEQLQAFTKLLDLPLYKAKTKQQLQTLLKDAQGADLILIDTAGTNPHDPDDMSRLSQLIEAGTIEPIMAMIAGTDADESAEIARSFAILGVERMMCTRLDVARRLGGLLSAAQKAGMSFTHASHTPKVTNGLFSMTPEKLAAFLINPDRALRATLSKDEPSGDRKSSNRKTAGRAT